MEKLKISIITPSFNQALYLEETIESVLSQGYNNLEYIIIDGGSTDNSVDIIKKYEKHLSYYISEPDKGQSDAIIKGYLKSTGDVINWLNSDDYYEPGALHKVGEAFMNPHVNVYCGISRVFSSGKDHYTKGTDIYLDNLEKTIAWARIDQPETFMRKEVWNMLGTVDPQYHYLMDKELWIRYLLAYGMTGILKTEHLIAHFRHHEQSKTVSQQDGFISEGFDLFYSMALDNNLLAEAGFLKKNFNTSHIKLNHRANHGDMKKILHYFLYYLYAEGYAENNFNQMNLTKQIIDRSLLSNADRKKFENLLLRSSIIPASLKKWWNRQ